VPSADSGTHKITLIPGDGIGPEVTDAVVAILEVAGRLNGNGCSFEWHRQDAGADAFKKTGEYIPKALYESLEANRVGLKGPVTTPIGGGFASINVTLRKKFELFANFRPIQNLPGLNSRYPGIDLIIVRENTEDLYAGLEMMIQPGVAQGLKIITEKASTRIAKFAFEYAAKHERKRIHAIHKANIMKLTDGLFLDCARKVAERFPQIEYREHIVDNTCMQLVLNPYQYDVILTENLYGDILSDLCSAFVGGLGMVPGANLGEHCAVFEAVHGSAPDIAGKDMANPTALLRSAVLMLHHLDEMGTAATVQAGLEQVYNAGKVLTRDVGGTSGTKAFADAVIAAMETGDVELN
jgi:isocitrate dehydrogenase (NAD+)